MSKLILPGIRRQAYTWVGTPLLVVLLGAGLLAGFGRLAASYSFLLGGMIWGLATFYLAYKLFANMSPRFARQIVKTFYWAELVKLVISGILFVFVIKWFTVSVISMLSGYLIAQVVFWITATLMMVRYGRKQD